MLATKCAILGILVIAFKVARRFYRLTLHPLARFPGHELAALSRLYDPSYAQHKLPRQAFESFFSRGNIVTVEFVIRENARELCTVLYSNRPGLCMNSTVINASLPG